MDVREARRPLGEENLLRDFTSGKTLVSEMIERMSLTASQRTQLTELLDQVLADTMYTLLLGLDGSASIGGTQEEYKIHREDGVLISDCGELEVAAHEAFHGNSPGGVTNRGLAR